MLDSKTGQIFTNRKTYNYLDHCVDITDDGTVSLEFQPIS
jgi:hypothetical protein